MARSWDLRLLLCITLQFPSCDSCTGTLKDSFSVFLILFHSFLLCNSFCLFLLLSPLVQDFSLSISDCFSLSGSSGDSPSGHCKQIPNPHPRHHPSANPLPQNTPRPAPHSSLKPSSSLSHTHTHSCWQPQWGAQFWVELALWDNMDSLLVAYGCLATQGRGGWQWTPPNPTTSS